MRKVDVTGTFAKRMAVVATSIESFGGKGFAVKGVKSSMVFDGMRSMPPHVAEQIAQLFKASKAVSTSNGCGYHMFKATAKRRRTKAQIKEQELQEAAQKL